MGVATSKLEAAIKMQAAPTKLIKSTSAETLPPVTTAPPGCWYGDIDCYKANDKCTKASEKEMCVHHFKEDDENLLMMVASQQSESRSEIPPTSHRSNDAVDVQRSGAVPGHTDRKMQMALITTKQSRSFKYGSSLSSSQN